MDKADAAFLELMVNIHQEIHVAAPIAVVFESILEQMGPHADMPNGQNMNMRFEPWPGGRWFRDLGNNAGHLWGHVQVIKPPTLLEITGPLMMSHAVINHVQYRLMEEDGGTKLTLKHRAVGDVQEEHRKGVLRGWEFIVGAIKKRAEAK